MVGRVVSTGVRERLNTSAHTHAHTLSSVPLSYVSYAVNQQACRPVAIPSLSDAAGLAQDCMFGPHDFNFMPVKPAKKKRKWST